MATMATQAHAGNIVSLTQAPAIQATGSTAAKTKRSYVSQFFADLVDDLRHNAFDPANAPEKDLFREHINALSISYFALIVVLIALSLPALAYMFSYTW